MALACKVHKQVLILLQHYAPSCKPVEQLLQMRWKKAKDVEEVEVEKGVYSPSSLDPTNEDSQ